jgi:lysine-N-methylase
MGTLPDRPRLAEHVVARRHLVGDRSSVVLHDLRSGRAVRLGAREWELLASADGTRDLDGILLAAAREGAHARAPHLQAFLAQLHDAGFLDGGEEEAAPAVDARADDDARELEVLADFALHCDGQGSCCRQYETVLFAPVEAARARATCPDVLGAGARHELAFLPEHGSSRRGGSAVALVGGACAYLDVETGLGCRIHAAGGEDAKPLGCRLFPATFVDDGVRVRVSAAVECACVLASVGRDGGAPLVSRSARARAALAPEIDVVRVPPIVRLAADRTATSAELHAWSRLAAAAPAPHDAVDALLMLADHIEREGLTAVTMPPADTARARHHDEVLRASLRALHVRIERKARDGAAWRGEADFAQQAITWMARACATLTDDLAPARIPPPDASREAFYVRAALFGHALALDDVPFASALRDRATRLVLARALGHALAASEERTDAALREPIAVVEAMLRGHGLAAYVHDVAPT